MTELIIGLVGTIFTSYFAILLTVTPFYRFLPDNIQFYVLNNWISLDQLLNTILFGDPDETISSRAYKHVKENGRDSKLNYYLLRVLEYIDPGHGKDAVEWDEGHSKK